MGTLIEHGTLVTASDTYQADLRIEGETIAAIGRGLPRQPGDEVIDATGRYVFPGGIDVHTHLELPFMGTVSCDDFATGTIAAACGATTTIIDFVIPEKGKSLFTALESWRDKARKAAVDYGFHMCITEYDDRVAGEIPELVREGVTSFKCFMAYKGALQIDDGQLVSALATAGRAGAMISVHAENGDMISLLTERFRREGKLAPEFHWRAHPSIAEEEAVGRAICLARFSEQPIYIVHLSGADGLAKIEEARSRGFRVYAETCPQYLLLSSDLYMKPQFEGAKWVMSPPLRPSDHHARLWDGLARGLIQVVATDHCPFNFKGQKEMGRDDFTKIPNGIASVGDRFNLLYTYGVGKGRLSLNRFVEVVATAPARIFGMYPKKGSLTVGGDADVVVFDPGARGTISAATQHHNCDYSAYEGFELQGLPETVLSRGRVVVQKGRFTGERGWGRYIRRERSGVA